MAQPMYFQWQNEVLAKTIYPMREPKLRDFLVYYEEIDRWAEYKNKAIAADVPTYQKAQQNAAITAYKSYSTLRSYFIQKDVRANYSRFKPIDEAELAEINRLHDNFINYFPKDIRGERDFVTMQMTNWTDHRNRVKLMVKQKQQRVDAIRSGNPNHEKLPLETQQLQQMQNVTLPMAEQELEQLRSFLATYDKIEKRKLEWYQLKKKDPNYSVPEADYLVQAPTAQPSVRDIVLWKIEEYKNSLQNKNQIELLEEVYKRFSKDPKRYPLWLQYMVVHFSGMRYASAHGSWADPKDLLIRLRASKAEKDLKNLDDTAVEKLSKEKVAAFEGPSKPKLALAQEKEWKDKVAMNLSNLKSPGPKTRRYGLTSMQADEIAYEVKSMTTAQALDTLRSMKATFPAWAWKEIIKLTPLRVTEVTDSGWETLTPQEEADRNSQQYNDLRMIIDRWKMDNTTNWREEHGRTHELIVSRAVCNETAEHIQHLRGHLPPGGLTPKPKWYLTNETENRLAGNPRPYYAKPVSEKDYTPGASILWLRFVDKQPDAWQIAKAVETKDKVGLLPQEFLGKKAGGKNDKKPDAKNNTGWKYQLGEIITRSRTTIDANKKPVTQQQWLRWIHEATVVEIAETAEGKVMLTYETALPDDDRGISSIGMFRKPVEWMLSDGTEDAYNRSFVGFVPEGQVPVGDLKEMLDWNKILRRQVV